MEIESTLILKRLGEIVELLNAQNYSQWMTTREVAEFLKCSVSKVDQLTSAGLLPFSRLDPAARKSPRLYHRKHVTGFLVAGRNPVKHRLLPSEKRQVQDLC